MQQKKECESTQTYIMEKKTAIGALLELLVGAWVCEVGPVMAHRGHSHRDHGTHSNRP